MSKINQIADQNTRAFAEACYDQNSIDELRAANHADETDCREWSITPEQWNEAVAAALADREAA